MTVRIEDFERHRSLLFSIAYRMLGSVAEAVGYVEGRPTGVVALDLADRRIRSVRIVVNPEKLRTIPPSPPSGAPEPAEPYRVGGATAGRRAARCRPPRGPAS
jgi:hypothetical protein